MKLKQSYLYQLREHQKPIIIFYIVVMIVLPLLLVTSVTSYDGVVPMIIAEEVQGEDGATIVYESRELTPEELEEWQSVQSQFSGMDAATVIFLFVCGLAVFREQFGMLSQNGVSRKTVFRGRIAAVLTIAFGMAVIDKINLIAFKWACSLIGEDVICTSLFEQLYNSETKVRGTLTTHVYSFIFCLVSYLAAAMFGYLISLTFYRLGKAGKISVAAGVPALLFIALPIVNFYVADGKITKWAERAFDYMFGFTQSLPFHAFVTLAAMFAVFSGLCWLLMRRAVVKD
ncbi:MAG: hypothetical protein FWF05_00470 [Oscillospiraceae bacterium]|nr:hypothetical protein [Oscillospiraceae bacterium]